MEARDFRNLTEAYYQVYQEQELDEEEKWIQKAIKKPGAFIAKAKEHDMSVAEFAKHVKANPDKFDSTTLKQANLAQTLKGLHKEDYELDEAKIDDELTGQQKKDIRNKRSKFGSSPSSKSKKTKLRHDLHKKSRGVKKVPGDKSGEEEILVLRRSQRMHGTLSKTQKVGGQKGIPEQLDLYDIILSHLLDEGYAETLEAAELMMVNMSEEWIDSILDGEYLYEMRKVDKVAGKEKTPLKIPGKRGTVQRTEGGGWKKQTPMVGNPKVSMGRQRQGAAGWGELYGYKRHAHGGAHGGMQKGSLRGKSRLDTQQARRAGPTVTPAQRVADRRLRKQQDYDMNR